MDGHFIDLYVHHKNENIWKKSHKLKKKKKKSCKSLQKYLLSQSEFIQSCEPNINNFS